MARRSNEGECKSMSTLEQEVGPVPGACPICKVNAGEYHVLGCGMESCPYCGGDFPDCLLARRCHGCESPTLWPPPRDDRLPWTGEWAPETLCRELGWYFKPGLRGRFVRCSADAPGAVPDWDRVMAEAIWCREEKRFRLPQDSSEGSA
jgi:hypothetical protein